MNKDKPITAGIIGASSESLYAISEAGKKGIRTVAVDGNPAAPGLAHADEGHTVDLRDTSAVFDFFDNHPVDFLLPVPVGRILTTAGAVNDRYGLPGVSRRAAELATDKWEFHTALAAQGLRKAEAVLFNKKEEISGISEMEFPVVVKPRFGSGSRAVKVYRSFADLEEDMADVTSFDEDYIAESCVPGTEYGVDAFIADGSFRMILLREKIITPEPYRQCVGYFAIEKNDSTEALFSRVNGLLSAAVKQLGLNNCLMHADVMDDGNESFIIELSPRPSGHYLHNYFTRYATGFDMLSEYIAYATAVSSGGSYELSYTYSAENMMIRYFDLLEGVVESLPDPAEIESMDSVLCYNCYMKEGDRLGKVIDGGSVMGRGFYVIKAPSIAEAMKISREIESKIVIKEC